jgi:hypothetical protein
MPQMEAGREREMRRKATQIAPAFNKGALQFAWWSER